MDNPYMVLAFGLAIYWSVRLLFFFMAQSLRLALLELGGELLQGGVSRGERVFIHRALERAYSSSVLTEVVMSGVWFSRVRSKPVRSHLREIIERLARRPDGKRFLTIFRRCALMANPFFAVLWLTVVSLRKWRTGDNLEGRRAVEERGWISTRWGGGVLF